MSNLELNTNESDNNKDINARNFYCIKLELYAWHRLYRTHKAARPYSTSILVTNFPNNCRNENLPVAHLLPVVKNSVILRGSFKKHSNCVAEITVAVILSGWKSNVKAWSLHDPFTRPFPNRRHISICMFFRPSSTAICTRYSCRTITRRQLEAAWKLASCTASSVLTLTPWPCSRSILASDEKARWKVQT